LPYAVTARLCMNKKAIRKSIVVLGVLAAVLLYCVQNDVRFFTVLTGSMAPSIPSGSLVISRGISSASVGVGRVILYKDGHSKRVTAHRIIRYRDGSYLTQGDANTYPDRYLVQPDDILGEVLVVIHFGSFLLCSVQLLFILLAGVLGILMRRFLVFFIKYGFSCPDTTASSVW
jgi:signal peptidase I